MVGCHSGKEERLVLPEKYLLRFLRRVIFDTNGGGCWQWGGFIQVHGYALFNYKRRRVLAHRLAYMHWNGVLPAGVLVMHSCDNRGCVNPSHLRIGTQADNIGDAVAKGRMASGERGGHATIGNADAIAIAAAIASGERQTEIARRFGVGVHIVNAISSGKSWSSVTGRRKPSP